MNPNSHNTPHKKTTVSEKRLYHEGPNYTADGVITRKKDGVWQILLVQRPSGVWGFPAGFRDPILNEKGESTKELEDPETTVIRETAEETGVMGLENVPKTKIFKGPVKDPRNEGGTGQEGSRWIETTAYHMDVTGVKDTEPKQTPDVHTRKSEWFDMEKVPQPLHGSHDEILQIVKDMYSF